MANNTTSRELLDLMLQHVNDEETKLNNLTNTKAKKIVEIEIKELYLIIDYLYKYNNSDDLFWMLCVKKDDLITNCAIKDGDNSYNINELSNKIMHDSKLWQSRKFLIYLYLTLAVILITLGILSFCLNHIGTALKVVGSVIPSYFESW